MFELVFPPETLFVRLQAGELGSLGAYRNDQEDILLVAEVLSAKVLTGSCPDQGISLSHRT